MNRWWSNRRTDSTPSDTTNHGGTPMTTTTTEARTVNPLIDRIPKTLDVRALFAALQPLHDLLGLATPDDYYAWPGLFITPEEIVFVVPTHEPPMLVDGGRAEAQSIMTVKIVNPTVPTDQEIRDQVSALPYRIGKMGWTPRDGSGTCGMCLRDGMDLVAEDSDMSVCRPCFLEVEEVRRASDASRRAARRELRAATGAPTVPGGQTLIASGWRRISGAGDCDFCPTEGELVAAYDDWLACPDCYVELLVASQP